MQKSNVEANGAKIFAQKKMEEAKAALIRYEAENAVTRMITYNHPLLIQIYKLTDYDVFGKAGPSFEEATRVLEEVVSKNPN